MGTKFLGRIPIDPEVARSGDEGFPLVKVDHDSATAQAMNAVIKHMLDLADALQENKEMPKVDEVNSENGRVRIAIPVVQGQLCMHFGHCEQFAMVDVDSELKSIISTHFETPPPHEPGVIPAWCADQKVNLVIAGGMGAKAQSMFTDRGVRVITGAPSLEPEAVVKQYLDGSLVTGANTCDH